MDRPTLETALPHGTYPRRGTRCDVAHAVAHHYRHSNRLEGPNLVVFYVKKNFKNDLRIYSFHTEEPATGKASAYRNPHSDAMLLGRHGTTIR